MQRGTHQRENLVGAGCPLVAVAIDENSQSAFRWALDNIIARGQTLIIIHVHTKCSLDSTADNALREIFIPYQCFCSRKNVHCKGIVLEDPDVSKAIVEFVLQSSIEKLVIGESPKGEFDRSTDLSSSISKAVPDFCTVIVISKGKVSSLRSAVMSAPPPLRPQSPIQAAPKPEIPNNIPMKVPNETALDPWNLHKETELIKIPFTRGVNISSTRSYGEVMLESDISFLNNRRLNFECTYPPRLSNVSDVINYSFKSPRKSVGAHSSFGNGYSPISYKSAPSNSQTIMDGGVEEEIRRLKLELKQTMGMYKLACKEALTEIQKAEELQQRKMEEKQRMREARVAEEVTLDLAEKEKGKCVAAVQTAEASKRICSST